MKKLILLSLCLSLLCVITSGCQNLMHKSVVLDNSVTAFKITLGDPSNNPFPQVIIGNGRAVLVDMPMQDGAEVCYYSEESSTFSSTISRRTTIYMKAGTGAVKGYCKVEMENGKIMNVPLFKMYNPFSNYMEIKVDDAVIPIGQAK